jgi:NAD(P)-dependent dehydrogenase (short-subunit alcohol dehydrogenase family)
MSERFSGQVALVAGGTGALGRAVTVAFLEEGGTVVVTYRKGAEFELLRGAAGAYVSRLEGHSVDVTNQNEVSQLVAAIIAKYGRLDVLINAVGGYAAGGKLWETDSKVLDQMLSLNLLSGYTLGRAVVPAMLKRGRGAIVNVASRAAIDHAAGAAAYAASKAAAVAMIDSLAADIDTEENRKAMPDADFAKWPKPREIADVILFLCSDAARLIHGASIPV